MTARRVVVRGEVQGVGFRYFVQRRARERSVAGWVTNRSDGAVEALFEGSNDDVESLVEACRSGPRSASVARVDVEEAEPSGNTGFSVH